MNSPILFGTEWHDCPFQKEVQTGDIYHRNLNLKTESAQHASLHPKFCWLPQKFWGPAVPRITGVQPNPQTWVDQVSGTSVQRRLQCEVRILPLVDGGKPAARSTGIPCKTRKHQWKECLQNHPFFWGDSETTEVNYQAADMLIRDQHFFESFRGGCNIQKLKRGRWVVIWHFGDDKQACQNICWIHVQTKIKTTVVSCKRSSHQFVNLLTSSRLALL